MSSNEDYRRNPAKELEKNLQACLWNQVGPRQWEKARSLLVVDDIGVFLFRFMGASWVRTHGLSHSRMWSRYENLLWFDDGARLDLLSGEWQ